MLEFLYSTSHDFTTQLRSQLKQDEETLISLLLNTQQLHTSVQLYGRLIATIMLSVDMEMLKKLIGLVTDKQVSKDVSQNLTILFILDYWRNKV